MGKTMRDDIIRFFVWSILLAPLVSVVAELNTDRPGLDYHTWADEKDQAFSIL